MRTVSATSTIGRKPAGGERLLRVSLGDGEVLTELSCETGAGSLGDYERRASHRTDDPVCDGGALAVQHVPGAGAGAVGAVRSAR